MNEFRSGYIALVGKPNVGKSTLINAVLGQKVAAVSPRPQTTRRRQLGILNMDMAQLVFVDLPGIHKPQHKLGKFLNQEAEEGLIGVDLIFWMVDGSQDPDEEDELIADMLRELKNPPDIMIGMNKTDRLKTDEEINQQSQKYTLLLPAVKLVSFSALRPNSRGELVEKLVEKMPVREADYPTDQLTDLYERDIAADLIREAALFFLRDEVPHGLAVRIDEFTERGSSGAFIAATLFVERDSQKGIVIGEKGLMLKKIGSAARHEIEAMGGRKVFLDLRVKVAKNWRNDENFLNRIGYKIKNTD